MRKGILLICIFAIILLLCACADNETGGETGTETSSGSLENTRFSITYTAEEGGYISGEAFQLGNEPFISRIVTAVPNDGYRFVGWSDGHSGIQIWRKIRSRCDV